MKVRLSLIAVITSFGFADTLDFSELNIQAAPNKLQGTANTSHRGEINLSTQDLDSIVRSIPGAYTATDQTQGTLNVNIRGMSGFGRVNTKIDGVSQTFFGTSADNGKFHESNGNVGTSNYGAMIDQNFLVGVTVFKGGGSSGSSGVNALMGSANFRTIGVDDLVLGDKLWGIMSKYSYGTNGIGHNAMTAFATKFKPTDSSKLGFLFGISGKKISQNYKIGSGEGVGSSTDPFSDPDEPTSTAPFNPKELTQKPKSYIFKTEYSPNELNDFVFQYRNYNNVLAGRKMSQNNYQLNYHYHPDNDLINLKALLAKNIAKQKYLPETLLYGRDDILPGSVATNDTTTFEFSNTSIFEFKNFDWTLNYGLNYLDNEYKKSLKKSDAEGIDSVPFAPSGRQILKTIFVDSSFDYNGLNLLGNFNLTQYTLKGHKGECYSTHKLCFPKAATNIKKSGKNFNYSLLASYEFHNLVKPFVSYSLSSRAPNVQEMFFSSNGGNSVNPFLRSERAKTFQVGISGEHKFSENRYLNFKLNTYQTKIKDYIKNLTFSIYTPTGGEDYTYLNVNNDEIVKFKGVELELNYDMRSFYTKFSYSHQNTKQPISDTYGVGGNTFEFSEMTELPKDYANLDLGFRFLNEKLNIGTIAKYTGKARRIRPYEESRDINNADENNPLVITGQREFLTEDLPKIPIIYDFYLSYEPIKNLIFKFDVQNLFNKNYMDALNAFNSTSSQYIVDKNDNDILLFTNQARGRTFLFSVSYKY